MIATAMLSESMTFLIEAGSKNCPVSLLDRNVVTRALLSLIPSEPAAPSCCLRASVRSATPEIRSFYTRRDSDDVNPSIEQRAALGSAAVAVKSPQLQRASFDVALHTWACLNYTASIPSWSGSSKKGLRPTPPATKGQSRKRVGFVQVDARLDEWCGQRRNPHPWRGSGEPSAAVP